MRLETNSPPAIIDRAVNELSAPRADEQLTHTGSLHVPMPSVESLGELMEQMRAILFPGYFGAVDIRPETIRYYLGTLLDQVYSGLIEQIKRGLCFECLDMSAAVCGACETRSQTIAGCFLDTLPGIRHLLASDVDAAYEGDPAAHSRDEVIFCYPSLRALTHHRVAHELYRLGVPIIPRIIAESAHSRTGIDIHPGAQIGERFFMDHGTGIVIGETCAIGRNVRLYQGVTLGAKSFPLDEGGRPIKGIPRHPIVEDDVIVYSGATILGRVTIGCGAVIGGNVWLTHGVPPQTRVLQGRSMELVCEAGAGI